MLRVNNIRIRVPFYICGAAALVMIALALHLCGASEVRNDAREIAILTIIGAVWLGLATKVFPWLGVDFQHDVVERNNPASAVAICGAVLAVAILYTGGSMGEGDSYYDNFFSAGLGTIGFLVLWVVLEAGTRISQAIAEDRDVASGTRLCGFLLAVSLVLGRATAGDWHSEMATIHDFLHDGWPAAVLLCIAWPVERIARPSHDRPFPRVVSFGVVPAAGYLFLSILWLWYMGPWEGMP